MWQYNYTDELYHYGVKGMRWGVRKAKRGEKRALGSAIKATTDKERNAALADAKKFRSEADRITKAHKDAKDNKKHMRLNEDGSITEISKAERTARGKKIAKGVVGGVLGTAAVGTVGVVAYSGLKTLATIMLWPAAVLGGMVGLDLFNY